MRLTLIAALVLSSVVNSAWAADDVAKTGQQLFERYCASCHGLKGQGDGPVAKSLAVEVPDLTTFARRHSDVFDREMVERIIDGRHIIGAHGTRTMPVWGEDLSRANVGDPDAERGTRTVIARLTDHLWQLQRPGAKLKSQ